LQLQLHSFLLPLPRPLLLFRHLWRLGQRLWQWFVPLLLLVRLWVGVWLRLM